MGTAVARIREIQVPFAPALNPDYERARRRNLTWMREMGLLTSEADLAAYDRCLAPKLAARVYPTAQPSELDAIVDLMGFHYLFDDQFQVADVVPGPGGGGPRGDRPDLVAQAVAEPIATIRGGGPSPTSAFGIAFADAWRRLLDGAAPAWQARISGHFVACLEAVVEEARSRAARRFMDVDEFLALHRHSGAVLVYFDLIERAGRFALADEVYAHPDFAAIYELGGDMIDLANDLISAEIEAAAGDVSNNLVLIAQHARGRSFDEAFDMVLSLHDERLPRYLEAKDAFLRSPFHRERSAREQEDVVAAFAGVEHWMSGYLAWSTETIRYGYA